MGGEQRVTNQRQLHSRKQRPFCIFKSLQFGLGSAWVGGCGPSAGLASGPGVAAFGWHVRWGASQNRGAGWLGSSLHVVPFLSLLWTLSFSPCSSQAEELAFLCGGPEHPEVPKCRLPRLLKA